MLKKHISAKILFEEAESQGLNPVWENPRGLFSIPHNEQHIFVYYTMLHINSQLGSWICKDKSYARAFLEKGGFKNIPWCYSNQTKDINVFFDTHKKIIQKPVMGMLSHNVKLISNREDIDMTTLEDSIFERYIEGTEYRCLILNGEAVAMQKKTMDPTPEHPWRKFITNVDKGEWIDECMATSLQIAQQLHMGFIAVDFIIDAEGTQWLLEINGMPGLHSFHNPDGGEPMNLAAKVLEVIMQS